MRLEIIMRLSKAVDYFGSMKALARALGLNPSTVQAWKKFGLVPKKWEADVNRLMQQPALQKLPPECVSVDSIIAKHGSVKAVAQIFEVTPNTIYRWRDAGRIPNESLAKLVG
jgi:transposase-like protein